MKRLGFIAFTAVILSTCVDLSVSPAQTVPSPSAIPPAPTAAEIAGYEHKLASYNSAQQQYAVEAKSYWDMISAKRGARIAKRRASHPIALSDYVLTQPPVYQGPPKPKNPAQPEIPETQPVPPAYIPVKADFLRSAAQKFNFVPRQPSSEMDYRKAYAHVAAAAGITKDQAVRIYSFEAGGNGTYDVQAGLEYNTPRAHAMSTALGYNQLLSANSVELLAEQGPQFAAALTARAANLSGSDKLELTDKIKVLQRMVAFAKSVPDEWGKHVKLGNNPEGLGIHALNLDVDIGPYLQVQKLLNSIRFARAKGRNAQLTAAELEMMNLTGDGNGFDMITVPVDWQRQVPTSNFFEQAGYQENPVVKRNNVVWELLAATNSEMDAASQLPGAKALESVF